MKKVIIILCFLSFSINISANNSNSLYKREKNARLALSLFDSLKIEKMIYSYSDTLFFLLLDRKEDNEFFVKFRPDTIIIKRTSIDDYPNGKYKKKLKKTLDKSQPIFSRWRYYHGKISWCPTDMKFCPHSSVHYFLYVDEKDERLLEFNCYSYTSALLEDLQVYFFFRTFDESEKLNYKQYLKNKK